MSGSALTKNTKITSHLRPFNLQLQIDDSLFWGVLAQYHWNLGMSDFEGNITYDWKRTRWGDQKTVNEAGVIVYPRVMADPRGGLVTLVATYFGGVGYWGDPTSKASGNSFPGQLLKSARYGKTTNSQLLFTISALRTSETNTNIGAGNKVTAGATAGGSIGVVNVGGNAGYEHTFASQSEANTLAGKLVGINLIWAKTP